MMLIYGPGIPPGRTRERMSVDDGYTPSIFKTVQYEFGNSSTEQGYLLWKPISYQSSSRKSTVSQQAILVYPEGRAINVTELPHGLATAMFGNVNSTTYGNATRLYIVFGTSGDDTYITPTYMTW